MPFSEWDSHYIVGGGVVLCREKHDTLITWHLYSIEWTQYCQTDWYLPILYILIPYSIMPRTFRKNIIIIHYYANMETILGIVATILWRRRGLISSQWLFFLMKRNPPISYSNSISQSDCGRSNLLCDDSGMCGRAWIGRGVKLPRMPSPSLPHAWP